MFLSQKQYEVQEKVNNKVIQHHQFIIINKNLEHKNNTHKKYTFFYHVEQNCTLWKWGSIYMLCSKCYPLATIYIWTRDCTPHCTLYNMAQDMLSQTSIMQFQSFCNIGGWVASIHYLMHLQLDRVKWTWRQSSYSMTRRSNVPRMYCWTLDILCKSVPSCLNIHSRSHPKANRV